MNEKIKPHHLERRAYVYVRHNSAQKIMAEYLICDATKVLVCKYRRIMRQYNDSALS